MSYTFRFTKLNQLECFVSYNKAQIHCHQTNHPFMHSSFKSRRPWGAFKMKTLMVVTTEAHKHHDTTWRTTIIARKSDYDDQTIVPIISSCVELCAGAPTQKPGLSSSVVKSGIYELLAGMQFSFHTSALRRLLVARILDLWSNPFTFLQAANNNNNIWRRRRHCCWCAIEKTTSCSNETQTHVSRWD